MARKSFLEYFADIARTTAQRSTCPRLQVGAVIVQQQHIIGTGYNGSIARAPHCEDVGCYLVDGHCQRCVHAEANAIASCARHGAKVLGATIYITHSPCWSCYKLCHNAGISNYCFIEPYHLIELLKHAGKTLNLPDAYEVEKELGLRQITGSANIP